MEEKIMYCIRGQVKDFGKIFRKLFEASYSISNSLGSGWYDCDLSTEEIEEREEQKIEDFLTEETVAKALVKNALFNRPTANGIGWGECQIDISAYGVDYKTSGGLQFGWTVNPEHDYNCRNFEKNLYTLIVYCLARPGGTLEEALIENDFVKSE